MADPTEQWAALEMLADPQRRAVYEVVCQDGQPLSRDQVGSAAGISGALAAFHLEKLVQAGLLVADARAPAGSVPKVGRPAKRYWRSQLQIDLTLPARQYGLAGQLLAAALEAAAAGEDAGDAARRLAHAQGRELAHQNPPGHRPEPDPHPLTGVRERLQALGYAPAEHGDRVTLRNCPFQAIVQVARDVACGMNLALLEGLLDGLPVRDRVIATLEPQADGCCVALTLCGQGDVTPQRPCAPPRVTPLFSPDRPAGETARQTGSLGRPPVRLSC